MRPPPHFIRRAPLIREPLRRIAKRLAPKGPITVRAEGLTFAIAPADNKVDFDIWYKRRLDEAAERDFLAAHLPPHAWFVDIGANIGLYTVSLLKRFPQARAIAFEPLQRLRARLNTNLDANAVHDRAVVCEEAIGPQGQMRLYESRNAGRSSLLAFEGAGEGDIIPVRPLAQLLTSHGVTPSALKIDVEGFEDKALLPYFDSAPPAAWPTAIVIETLHRAVWSRDCLQELRQRGYVMAKETDENACFVRRHR